MRDVAGQCAVCGYDLRGLDPSGLCPECGNSIQDAHWLRFADPAWTRTVHRGTKLAGRAGTWLVIAVVLGPLQLLAFVLPYGSAAGQAAVATVATVLFIAAPVVSTYGCWLLTTPEPETDRRRSVAQAASILAPVALLGNLLMFGMSGPLVYIGSVLCLSVFWIHVVALEAGTRRIMRRCARWSGRRSAWIELVAFPLSALGLDWLVAYKSAQMYPTTPFGFFVITIGWLVVLSRVRVANTCVNLELKARSSRA